MVLVRMCVPALLSALTVPAHAQDLTPGTWSGDLKLTAGGQFKVEFTVRGSGDQTQATMNAVDGPASPVTDLQLSGGDIAFRWVSFACSLTRVDDSELRGNCETEDGSTGLLSLTAPESHAMAPDVLVTSDLVETRASDMYEALQRLRPYWIRPRGQGRLGYSTLVKVYIDRQVAGDASVLRSINPVEVEEVLFYSPSEATMRFGTNNEGGAILLTMRRGRP